METSNVCANAYLTRNILAGDLRAASRLMSYIDDEQSSAIEELKQLYPHTGKAHVVGITGTPGAGKSTLVNMLVSEYRAQGKTVGVIAVDPTSPFSGGAILGDRIRMQQHTTDDGVFIRSLATRGYLGGVSRSTHHIIKVMDAMGRDIIIVETVGVGQDEIDIVNMADTSIVVMVPGQGDSIQAMKAGILEIADIFVINKCDREGTDKLEQLLKVMVQMSDKNCSDWVPPVYRTEAPAGKGVRELVGGIYDHRRMLHTSGLQSIHTRMQAEFEFLEALKTLMMRKIVEKIKTDQQYDCIVDRIAAKTTDPFSAAERILGGISYDDGDMVDKNC